MCGRMAVASAGVVSNNVINPKTRPFLFAFFGFSSNSTEICEKNVKDVKIRGNKLRDEVGESEIR